MKWIDVPPVWLAGFVALAWVQSRHLAFGLGFGGHWADLLGGMMIGGGLLLMVLALSAFRRHATTVHPHGTPERLIQSGIFSRSRNPIYVGDALLLAGFVLRFDAVLALPLVPIFIWVIEQRFILPEENRLRKLFRADYARYERKVRRWL
ncbi:methyltransferase family protein [Microbulbifer sp. S227A]|uniref:methyltransferase family protein n=1 Tax=Microbulbifer sp. S227A TaxID=3415131 RepID=UPI003C7CC30A